MNKPVKIVVGGEEISVPPLNLDRLEKIADHFRELAEAKGLMARGRALADVFSGALRDDRPDLTSDAIGKLMFTSEIDPLMTAAAEFFRESGLISAGEVLPEETNSVESASAQS